ncbi:MAG: TOBE domain-containing protein, partial [Gammaproteobacteria bacterium]|nr:TOBE domain-containing protein [Gammaproteobacteria bacterium]
TSILNIVPARIEALDELEEGLFAVRLAVGDTPMLARITRKSVVELGLAPGLPVFAQVKSIALLQ